MEYLLDNKLGKCNKQVDRNSSKPPKGRDITQDGGAENSGVGPLH